MALCAAPFSPPSSAARARITGMGPRGETDAMVAHTPVPESAGSRMSSNPATCALRSEERVCTARGAMCHPLSPPSSAARARITGMGPRGETDAMVAHTPVPESAGSRLSSYPATCALQPAADVGRLSAWQSGLGGARSIVYHSPCTRCVASLRCPPPVTPLLDLRRLLVRPATCDRRPATCSPRHVRGSHTRGGQGLAAARPPSPFRV